MNNVELAATPPVERQPLVVTLAEKIARYAVNQPPSMWLILCGLLMALIFQRAFTDRYRLDAVGHLPQQTIATLNNMSADGAFIYIAGFGALFGVYWFGYRVAIRRARKTSENRRLAWLSVMGLAVVMNAVLLPLYPVDAADIYDYIMRGRMLADYNLNPLKDVPNTVGSDPFLRFSAWNTVPSAYGPVWELLAGATSKIVGDDPIANVIGFKLLSVAGYALALIAVWLTLKQIAPRRALTGVYLFAWNPLILFMTSGTGHNDTLMVAFILLSVCCLVRRWYVAATLAALLGALIKFIPVLLVPLIFVVAMRELKLRGRIRYVVLCAVLGGGMGLAAYGPFWFGLETLRAERRTQMYTGSFATIIRQELVPSLDPGKDGSTWVNDTPNTNRLLSNLTLGLFIVVYLWQLWDTYEKRDPITPIRAITLILTFYLLVSCLWFQAWYAIWIIGLAVLLEDAPLRRLILLFGYLVTWQPFLYNYVTLRPGEWAPLPWRDLIPVSVFMGGSTLYIVIYWLGVWVRSGTRTPTRVQIGEKLRAARQVAGLSTAEMSDELAIGADALLGYERGDVPLPFDHIERLCARLNLSVADLVGKS